MDQHRRIRRGVAEKPGCAQPITAIGSEPWICGAARQKRPAAWELHWNSVILLHDSWTCTPERARLGLEVMASSVPIRYLSGLAALVASLAWAYWPTLTAMADKWWTDPQYSHGFLVPAFAAYLLWHRRQLLPATLASPSFCGLLLVGLGLGMHLVGAYIYFDALAMASLLPVLAGLALCYGGWPMLRWSWPSIGFLMFMLPLPFRVEVTLSHPLQRLATICSTYVLQTLGLAAVAEGNIIILDNARIGVIEACNGLGMLVTFFAMATATVLVVRRPVIESALVILSAIPIALAANVVRITVTGICHELVSGDAANIVFHDLAGWLMMPLALSMLWLELRLFALLLIDTDLEGLPQLGLGVPVRLAAKTDAAPKAEAKLV
jgi:exosortase